MHYIFKILVLGDPETSNLYVSEAFNDVGESREDYYELYKEIKVLEDYCDLEVNIISNISADFDELLSTADGIIYLLNPMELGEFELFKMVVPDIFSIKRDMPIVVIFYDYNGILPISVNELLETIWVNYPNMETFVNLSPDKFHQALQCLCLAMINGDSPLNIENAWMRFPIFIQMANIYYDYKNYYYAAQAVKQASTIAEIYNMDEFFILCEQAAFLYSKLNLYLEASKVLEKTDPKKSKNYKKLYAEAMMTDANRLFNNEKYDDAAKMYEKAAQWSSIEFIDKNIIKEAFRLAISSWISACKVQNAFRILESLPHYETITILKEIIEKVIAEADYLISVNNLELAREQLYRSIEKYQREALFEELKKLTKKITEVLTKLLELQVKENELYAAKQTYDEIENIWESYNVERVNLDSTLERLIKLFLEKNNFGLSSILLNKLDSLKLKKKLTELSSKYEDEFNASRRREITEKIRKGINILNEYVEFELDIIANTNKEKIEEARELVKINYPIKAAQILEDHAKFIRQIGKTDIANQIFTKALDILLDEKIFEEFFEFYKNLTNKMKKKYLVRIFTSYLHNLKDIINKKTYKQNYPILENSIRIYRDEELYEESKQISLLFIEVIKNECIRILQDKANPKGVNKVSQLIKYISIISEKYLDKPERLKIDLDEIFKKMTEICIESGDLYLAHTYNDKIENKQYKVELHKKIVQLEGERSALESKKKVEAFKSEILKERLSIVKTMGQEAAVDKSRKLKERTGLIKRSYFQEALEALEKRDFNEAVKIYKENISKFNRIKNYELAGLCLVIAILILIKQNKYSELNELLDDTKKQFSKLGKVISESFPIKLAEHIVELERIKDEKKLKEAISYIENLPLFEEEIRFLYEYLGKEYKKALAPEKTIEKIVDIEQTRKEIEQLADSIIKEKSDIAKRKLMKNQYWKIALLDLSNKKFLNSSISYLDTISKLIEKNFIKQAAISLIVGPIILMKVKSIEDAEKIFNKYLKENKVPLERFPEIKITQYLFSALKNNEKSLIQLCINIILEKLPLLDPEIEILKFFLPEKEPEEEVKEVLTRKEYGELSKLLIELDQRYAKIKSKLVDIRRDKNTLYNKRKALKKRYYQEILELLKSEEFEKVAKKYYELAFDLSKRKDLETSSFIILLYGLVLMKTEEPLENISFHINNYLDNLGINRKFIEETYYIMLILFIIDVKRYKIEKFLLKIDELLEYLPLFEEEKVLLEINTET